MKKIVTAIVVCLAITSLSYAQCDKKVTIKASKTEYLGADSSVERTVDEPSEIVFDKTSITIVPGSEEKKMTGTISSYTCNFSKPFKDGKLVLKASLTNSGGESRGISITIESKDGKTTLIAQPEGRDRIIRVIVDTFEESK